MQTLEIARPKWMDFFNEFNRRHAGMKARVEVFDFEIGAQVEAWNLPFEGVCADLREGFPDLISITLGEKADAHLTHTVAGPRHIRLEQNTENFNDVLQIESYTGMTLIRFRDQ